MKDASEIPPEALNGYIDHTLLKPEAAREEIVALCNEAITHKFKTVCVNGSWAALCSELLEGSGVKVGGVVGFPLGASPTRSKAFEAQLLVEAGATEVDMVMNVGFLKSGFHDRVVEDIREVVAAAGEGIVVKVILETCLLEEKEILQGCEYTLHAGASFVKTSTGMSIHGATEEHVALMRQAVGDQFGVKASGGIRSYETAVAMIAAGANRLGTSSGISIIRGATGRSSY